jgi:1-acyl-sn-glycerol-3-phosphate acyltransferase
MIKSFLGAVFMIWGAIVFLITLLIFWIPMWATRYLYDEPKRTQVFLDVVRVWMAIFLPLSGIRFTTRGKEHFKKGENYVVVFNHNSFMDVPISTTAVPGANKTIAKHEFINIPVFGMVYSRGSVLVKRDSEASRKESYNNMKKVLEAGMHMCIYPEGTRNRTGQPLKKFQDGAFRLAVTTGKPIIPAVILNTGKVLPSNRKFFFWPMPLSIHFLEPIPVSKEDAPEEIKEKVYQTMWNYIKSREDKKGNYVV